MGGQVKLSKRFVPGTYAEVRAWLDDKGVQSFEPISIAPNTTVRYEKYKGKWACTYRFYNTDIVTLVSDGSIVLDSEHMSATTRSRMNQFLSPLKCGVGTKAGAHYFMSNGTSLLITKEVQRFKLEMECNGK